MSEAIHIVCLDAPSPPDYGGAIDMFYKIKALHEIGKKVTLHYFGYNPARGAKELEQYCIAIHVYERKSLWQSLPLSRPYIVQSRINRELIGRLNADNHPVLLEGLHCAGLLPFLQNKERVILRMHNEEASYYRQLAKTERSFLKRLYFLQESRLLHRDQKRMEKTVALACLSEADMRIFENEYGFRKLFFLPCFLPWQEVNSLEGKGDYCLYHGNLAVSENEEAVRWLIEEVFSQLPVPFVVAGKNISARLKKLARHYTNITLVNNPPEDELQAIVRDAHIHVLPSLNNTGVKLKLLNALLNGRFCLTNAAGVQGSRIQRGIEVQEDSAGWIAAVTLLMEKAFTAAEIAERKEILSLYHNRENAKLLSAAWSRYR